MKIFGRIILYVALISLFGFLLVQLFFMDEYAEFSAKYLHGASKSQSGSEKTLNIAYAFGVTDLDPVEFDPSIRSRILNIYEPLVQTDRNLQIQPCLALSWGRLTDNVWEFHLRPDVVFHDGTIFDADDVIRSYYRAVQDKKSSLVDILKTIQKLEKVDDLTIKVITKDPDPMLVNRLSTLLIAPSEKKDFSDPIGTGPYVYSIGNENLDELTLTRNADYWGDVPYYKNVIIKTIKNRFDRFDAIKNGEIDILANVPPLFAAELKEIPAVTVTALPSLEVNFLIFNMEDEVVGDKRIRAAIVSAIDKDAFVEFSKGYAQPSEQFVSNGIFGFNPDIEENDMSIAQAKEVVREYNAFKRPQISIDMTQGTEVIGEYIKEQLDEIGITVSLNFLSWDNLQDKINNKESQVYYLGWRSEIGDSSDFFENVIYSSGAFNGGNYLNKKIDQLVELSLKNLDQEKRLQQLHEIMRVVVEEDIVGVPLFESDVIYGVRAGVQFRPRLDGSVLASEIY
ncbi:hypothetical protein KKD70_02330 [Patescibacteria group bacterium]|nr:hypothetical protein [Patescibacteria group bacterium]